MSDRDDRAPLVLLPTEPRKPNPRVIHKPDLSVEWFTPGSLRLVVLDVLNGPPQLDPATSPANPLGADVFWTKDVDALIARDWYARASAELGGVTLATAFCNPPYGRTIRQWIKRLAKLGAAGVRTLALLPCRPGSRWYIEATRSAQLLCEINGRVTYELPSGEPAPFPARWAACFVYWGPDRQVVARKLRSVGEVRLCTRLPGRRALAALSAAKPIDPRQLRLVKP